MIVLAFCWAHVRRDFLDIAKSWPALDTWMFSWVERIGALYHLNAQRRDPWDETHALEDQSPAFKQQQLRLEEAAAHMKADSERALEKQLVASLS